MSLCLVGVVQIHQVDRLKTQVGLTCCQLVFQELGVHAVNSCCDIFIGNQPVFFQLRNQHVFALAEVCIVWNIAIFRTNKDLVTGNLMFMRKSPECRTKCSLCFLTPVIDRSVKNINPSACNKVYRCIVDIKICCVIWVSYVRSKTYCAKI